MLIQQARIWQMVASQFASGQVIYAGFWWRVLAVLIDAVVCWFLVVALAFIAGIGLSTTLQDHDSFYAVGQLIGLVGPFLYYAGFECSGMCGTPGKWMCSIKVVDEKGEQISFGRAVGRNLGKYVSGLILGIGFMMAGWTHRKQALHDKMAGTLVVRTPRHAERVALPAEG
jgi:uncharacterized RDD family membrane protein YckC